MKLLNTTIIICFVFSLFTTLEAQDNIETTLEDLLMCNETWGSVFKRDLANGSKIRDPRNIKKVYLSEFDKQNHLYTPKTDMKIFEGKVITFSTTAGTSPGVSVLLDIDFKEIKKTFEDKYKIVFDECRQTKHSKGCSKKISKSQTFMILETGISKTKKGVMAACALPYRR